MTTLKEQIIAYIESKPENAKPDIGEMRMSLAGNCPRQLEYDAIRGPGKIDWQTYMRFETGHKVHDLVRDVIREMFGLTFEGEEREIILMTPKGNKIVGHCDGIINKTTMLEIKSVSDAVFDMVMKLKRPLDEHYWQANLYAIGTECTLIKFIYVNKNNGLIECFEDLKPSLDQANWNLDIFDMVIENRKAGKVSGRAHHDATEAPCFWCAHKEICYEGFAKEVDGKVEVLLDSPKLWLLAKEFMDTRLQRLKCEKIEDQVMKQAVDITYTVHNAKEAILPGNRTFKISLKVGKNNNMLGRIEETKPKGGTK